MGFNKTIMSRYILVLFFNSTKKALVYIRLSGAFAILSNYRLIEGRVVFIMGINIKMLN